MTYILKEADRLRNQGKSLEAANKYLEVANDTDDDNLKCAAIHMAAVSLNQAGQHQESEKYFKRAVELYESLQDEYNFARVLRDFGTSKLNQQDYKTAQDLLNQSITILKNTKDWGELAMTQSKFAVTLARLDKTSDSENLAYEAITNANKSKNSFYVATAYGEAGRVYFINNKPEFMLDCLYSAIGALQLENDPHTKRHAELYLGLVWAYNKLNNKELAQTAQLKGEENLKQLDKETADRIKSYFNE